MNDRDEIVDIDDGQNADRPSADGSTRALGRSLVDIAPIAVVVGLGLVVSVALGPLRPRAGPAAAVAPPPAASPAIAATASPPATRTPRSIVFVRPAVPSQGPSGPLSAGKVPEAGIVYLLAEGQVYRYDGSTGGVTSFWARSSFAWETPEGVSVLGRASSADLLRWDGPVAIAICGEGVVIALARSGACAYRDLDGATSVRLPGEAARRKVLPADWGGGVVWDPTGTRLALLRSIPGATFEERGHNAIWLLDRDGSLRELYRPSEPTAIVSAIQWSPDGRWLTASEYPLISNSVAADGVPLLLIEVATGRVTQLGISKFRPRWSPHGELAFVLGAGRETWRDKRLVIRGTDGSQRVLAIPDETYVQLAPAWSGRGLAFVVGPSGGVSPDYMAGVGIGARFGLVLTADGRRTEVRCPSGVVEGVRLSADGSSYLVLCRTPGDDPRPLSIWWGRVGRVPVPILSGLVSDSIAAGFGYYGSQPNLNEVIAWSKAVP